MPFRLDLNGSDLARSSMCMKRIYYSDCRKERHAVQLANKCMQKIQETLQLPSGQRKNGVLK